MPKTLQGTSSKDKDVLLHIYNVNIVSPKFNADTVLLPYTAHIKISPVVSTMFITTVFNHPGSNQVSSALVVMCP